MDIFSDPTTKKFFITISNNAKNLVHFTFLCYQNIPIAYLFSFSYRKILAGYQTAYLYDYGKLRPGKTMFYHLLQSLTDKNKETLDLGGGLSTYKQQFTSDYRLLYGLSYSNNKLFMIWWRTINFSRRIKQIFFHIKNSRDHEFLFKTYKSSQAQASYQTKSIQSLANK